MFTVTSIYVISCLHLLHNIFTNLSPLWILLYKYFSSWEILRNYSTIFRSSHQRCSIKKAILKHFVIFTGKHLCRGLFFNKVAGHQPCNFIKKRPQHRYYLANIRKFIRRTILKNISERLHCWKVFCENVFQIRSELSKRNYWWLAVWKVAQISQGWINMLPIIKYYMRGLNFFKKRLNSYTRAQPQLLEKFLWKIR